MRGNTLKDIVKENAPVAVLNTRLCDRFIDAIRKHKSHLLLIIIIIKPSMSTD